MIIRIPSFTDDRAVIDAHIPRIIRRWAAEQPAGEYRVTNVSVERRGVMWEVVIQVEEKA